MADAAGIELPPLRQTGTANLLNCEIFTPFGHRDGHQRKRQNRILLN
jgi:hypothetical protein